MKKTNIRVNNFFIIVDKKKDISKYFLTDIDELNDWIELSQSELKKHKKKEITKELTTTMEDNQIFANVNFYNFIKTKEDLESNNIINVNKLNSSGGGS
tara:strand:- start:33 stop:329 length:297 start_codon:yes stop_codon:yes gene_type:complete